MKNIDSSPFDYCPDSFVKKALSILDSCFQIENQKAIQKAYTVFRGDFYSDTKPSEVQKVERAHCRPRSTDEKFLHEFKAARIAGIDLPVLISKKGNPNNKTIMIVGQDALRGKSFENFRNDIVLSTPFGTHNLGYRRTRYGKLYWTISASLLDRGYNLYFTDVRKLWLSDKAKQPRDIQNIYADTLTQEKKVFSIDNIIAFGKVAQKSLGEEKHIKLTHPAAWASWGKVSDEEKIQKLLSDIEEKLK